MAFDLSVNVLALSNNKEFTRDFSDQRTAETYIRQLDRHPSYRVIEFNFTPKFTNDELDIWEAFSTKMHKEAIRLEKQAIDRTRRNLENPNYDPCEVCGEKHHNYECCEQCNYNDHLCHFCGDDLGHSEVSVCYILEGFNE